MRTGLKVTVNADQMYEGKLILAKGSTATTTGDEFTNNEGRTFIGLIELVDSEGAPLGADSQAIELNNIIYVDFKARKRIK